MTYMLPAMMKILMTNGAKTLFQPSFFEIREARNLGQFFKAIKPVIQFPNQEVDLKYDVGTRGNGTDMPKWPEDLSVQIVL